MYYFFINSDSGKLKDYEEITCSPCFNLCGLKIYKHYSNRIKTYKFHCIDWKHKNKFYLARIQLIPFTGIAVLK
jgi:hypothetical protein